MTTLLFLKLTIAPGLVWVGTLVGRKWGPRVGGFVAGFPNSAGPILLLIAMERGASFGSKTAASGLLGLIALAAFNPAYVWTARKAPVWLSLLAGWSAFIIVMLLLRSWHPSLIVALISALGAINLARISLPDLPIPDHPPTSSPWELPLRLVSAVLIVLTITEAAEILGPSWSGMLSPFPVISAVLAAFSHASMGAAGASRTLKGVLLALNAVALFMAIVSYLLPVHGITVSFTLALTAGAALQFAVYQFTKASSQR
jgi:hypothetical protein